MHVQERFPQFQIPDGEDAEAPEKIDNSKVDTANYSAQHTTHASSGN